MQECMQEARVGGGVPLGALDIRAAHASSVKSGDASLTDYLLSDDTTVVAVDGQLNVLCSMSNAASLLGDQEGLSITNARLRHADAKVQQALRLALANALDAGERSTIVVPGSWGYAWHVVVIPEASSVFSSPPRAVLRIERRHIFRRPDAQTLQSVLGLSQAEARMLCELICGHCVSECAGILGVSVATVRKHLAATLKKTCCSRQSELMRLVSIVT
jgi:DNA-binding CsgD family transcriptional regulator